MSANRRKDLEYYLSLNYEITLRKMTRAEAGSNEPRYVAQIPLLKGVMAEGKEPQEALANLERVKRMAFELMLAQGKDIAEPVPENLHAEFA
jgi:predicted RNase H-like HicB family nuclease